MHHYIFIKKAFDYTAPSVPSKKQTHEQIRAIAS